MIVNAVATNPALGTMRLISKNAGFGFNLSVSKAPLASPGTITSATIVANQSNTYSYEWFETDAAGTISSTANDFDLTLDNLQVSGTKYYMLRTTSNGCSIESPPITIVGPTPVLLSVGPLVCSTEIQATASGGSPGYIYQIYNNNGLLLAESPEVAGSYIFEDGDSGVAGSTLTISGGNVYQIGVKDDEQCTFGYPANNLITVTTPAQLNIDETTIDVQQADCNGNGSITIDDGGFTVSNFDGTVVDYSDLQFRWDGSTGNTFFGENVASAPPGDYTLTVTNLDCPDLTATSIPVRILPAELPILPTVATSSAPANCSDGHIEVQFTGLTTSTFSYQWTNPLGIVIDSGSNIAPAINTLRIEYSWVTTQGADAEFTVISRI